MAAVLEETATVYPRFCSAYTQTLSAYRQPATIVAAYSVWMYLDLGECMLHEAEVGCCCEGAMKQ